MHPQAFLATLAVMASASSAMKVQWYNDNSCSNYAFEQNNPAYGQCYNNGSKKPSANIANCDHVLCYCTFYTGAGCTGSSGYVSVTSGVNPNCALKPSGSAGWDSFKCTWYM
ncbi:hypothetical protein V8F20_005377 [Naviculisporaceae sp. PSN 640]